MPGVKKNSIIAAFDFDGTIIKGDSFWVLVNITHSPMQLMVAAIRTIGPLLAYLLRLQSNSGAKQALFKTLYGDWDFNRLLQAAKQFQTEMLQGMVYDEVAAELARHKAEGNTVVIVSATFSFLLGEWCAQNGYGLLSTEAQVVDGKVTGRFVTPNCYGPEKVKRLKAWIGDRPYTLYAYGDSNGDRELLALADFKYYRHFKK